MVEIMMGRVTVPKNNDFTVHCFCVCENDLLLRKISVHAVGEDLLNCCVFTKMFGDGNSDEKPWDGYC